jgi:hypothetical protein
VDERVDGGEIVGQQRGEPIDGAGLAGASVGWI